MAPPSGRCESRPRLRSWWPAVAVSLAFARDDPFLGIEGLQERGQRGVEPCDPVAKPAAPRAGRAGRRRRQRPGQLGAQVLSLSRKSRDTLASISTGAPTSSMIM